MLREPERVGERVALSDLRVVGSPAPPPENIVLGDAAVVQFTNSGTIVFKLGEVVGTSGKHQSLGSHVLAASKGQAQFNQILGRSFVQS